MKAVLFILAFFSFIFYSKAQTESEQTTSDSAAISALINQSRDYIKTDRDRAKTLAGKAFQLALANKNSYLSAAGLLAVADAERFTGNINTLLADETNAVVYAAKSKNDELLFRCLNAHAMDLITLSRFDEASSIIDREKSLPVSFYTNADYKARLLNTQGYFVLKQQHSMADAKVILNQSLAMANEAHNLYLVAKNKLFLFRAMLFSGVRDTTASYGFEALNFFQKNDHPEDEANCDFELANSYRFLADLNKSIEYAQAGYDLMSLHQNHLGAAAAQNTIFQNCLAQKRMPEAKKAVDLMNEHYTKLNFENGMGAVNVCYGAWYSANAEYSKADSFFKKADEIAERRNLPLLKAALYMYESQHYQAQNKTKEADSLALKAYALSQKNMPKELLKNIYSSKDSAKLSKSQALDKRLFNDSSFREQHGKEALEALHRDNELDQIYKPVLSAFDSGLNSTYNKQLTELETQYKTKQKDDSLRLAKQKSIADTATIQKQNLLVTSVAVVALLLAGGFYLQYKNRKRAERDKAKIELLQNEIHHRVKNNLGVINRLIEVAGKRSTDTISLQALQTRVMAIELLHKRLYNDKITGNISLQNYLLELTAAIQAMFETDKQINISIHAPVEVSSKTAEKLGLIVNELVTNSYKYAFDEQQNGSINIEAKATDAHKYKLTVADNGKGFSDAKNNNYGMKLIAGLSHELGGDFAFSNKKGTEFILQFADTI